MFIHSKITKTEQFMIVLAIIFGIKTSEAAATDCKDVCHYYCPFDGSNLPEEAIKSNDENLYIKLPIPYIKKADHAWSRINPSNSTPSSERLFCSYISMHDSFNWRKNEDLNIEFNNASLEINNTHKFIVDGLPIPLTWGYKSNNYTDYFLNMDCDFTGKEILDISFQFDDNNNIWRDYNIGDNIVNCVEGGVDEPLNQKPFYIALTRFQNKVYVAKIIQNSAWLEVFHEELKRPVYITGARDIKVLCGYNAAHSFDWASTSPDESAPTPHNNNAVYGNIYRCYNGLEYLLTNNLELCGGNKTEILLNKSAPNLNNNDVNDGKKDTDLNIYIHINRGEQENKSNRAGKNLNIHVSLDKIESDSGKPDVMVCIKNYPYSQD